jgi:hypothetical protein
MNFAPAKPVLTPDDYFLSARNPLANADQRDLEARAIRIFALPKVKAGQQQMAQRWRTIAGRDITAEAERRFGELVEEFAFNYVMKAVNGDANFPKVMSCVYGPPHEWMGQKVPGARGSGGDGPDHAYSFIPLDYGARFEVTGQRFEPAPADTPYTLTGSVGFTMTLNSLDGSKLQVGPDGRFTITLDPNPANGRPNHIQTKPDTRYLFIRECRSDWGQVPAAHRVTRLDPPARPPLTDEQMADRAVSFMNEDVPTMYWFVRTFAALEVNTITPPFGTGAISGLVSQQISFARLILGDDDAFVATIGSGGARFRDFVLHDPWFRTFDYWNRTASMNNAQGVANDDGSTTYVISVQDPGVHNWLDPAGFHELLVVHRWQGLAADGPGPSTEGKLVKFCALDHALPAGMKRVTAAERRTQLEERLASFKLRFADD